MPSKRNVSSLSKHKLYRKQGKVVTPFNDSLGDRLLLSSWTEDRMPEYLWLGLIIMEYGRQNGFEKAGVILLNISKKLGTLTKPKLSKILELTGEEQVSIFQIILNEVDAYVLSPLTILYRAIDHPEFNDFFNFPEIRFEERLARLNKAIEIYSPHQSNEATDLRFLALSLLLFNNKIKISKDATNVIDALSNYPYTEHENESMRMYRSSIRAMENAFVDDEDKNLEFSKDFWSKIGMITKCNPISIVHKQKDIDCQPFTEQMQEILQYILSSYKSESLSDDKFDVIVGSITYALKVFIEIHEKALGNSVLGRHGARTIIEIFIILKYLLSREKNKPSIWEEYKLYGISKYKLILLKARENNLNESSHFVPLIAEMLVNEIRWEEFIDIDLKYFDKQGIREKSIDIGEKDIFDIFYDYDSNFTHGLWGAIREASMLKCDNESHPNHIIPDIFMVQTLPDVTIDCFDTMKKLLDLLTQNYTIPEVLLLPR